jgi:hypothetical protein
VIGETRILGSARRDAVRTRQNRKAGLRRHVDECRGEQGDGIVKVVGVQRGAVDPKDGRRCSRCPVREALEDSGGRVGAEVVVW